MKNKFIVIIASVIVLFGALYFAVDYKNNKAIANNDNPYGKGKLKQETIDQLKDPLYQNQITPDALEKKLAAKEDVTLYIYSPICKYCLLTTPILVPLADDLNVDLKKLNLLEFDTKKLRNTYDIKGTPTLIHFENGEEVDRIYGMPENAEKMYEAFFKENVVTN